MSAVEIFSLAYMPSNSAPPEGKESGSQTGGSSRLFGVHLSDKGPLGRLLYYPEAGVACNLVFLHKGGMGRVGSSSMRALSCQGRKFVAPRAEWQVRVLRS